MNTQSHDYPDEKNFWRKARLKADQDLALYFQRLDEFASVNEMKRCPLHFGPASIIHERQHHESSEVGFEDFAEFQNHRAVDHVVGFKRHCRPVAILTEPYDTELSELDDFEDYLHGKGLILHVAPALMSSFHNPGRCASILITKPNFAKVKWWIPY